MGKAIVAAVLERSGKIRTRVVEKRKKKDLQSFVRENVEAGSSVFTDELLSYEGLDKDSLFSAFANLADKRATQAVRLLVDAV